MAPHHATEESVSTVPRRNGQPEEHASSRNAPARQADYLAALALADPADLLFCAQQIPSSGCCPGS